MKLNKPFRKVLSIFVAVLHDTLKVCANGDYILNGRLVLFDYEKDANHNSKENYGGTSVAGVFYEYNYFS